MSGDRLGVLLKLGFYGFLVFIGVPLFAWILSPFGYVVAATGATFGAGIVANAISVRVFERAGLASVGLAWGPGAVRHAAWGFAAGVIAGACVTLLPLLLGLATLEPDPRNPASPGGFFFVSTLLLFGAIGEELLFRGYGFQVLWRTVGTALTLFISAVLFGLVHMQNLNVNPWGIVNTIAFGLVLGYAFIRTGDLWLPIGFHFGWNWMLPLAGVQLSGFNIGLSGYTLRWSIGDLWSGGLYGPEAGLPASLVACGLAVWLSRFRPGPKQIDEPPPQQEV